MLPGRGAPDATGALELRRRRSAERRVPDADVVDLDVRVAGLARAVATARDRAGEVPADLGAEDEVLAAARDRPRDRQDLGVVVVERDLGRGPAHRPRVPAAVAQLDERVAEPGLRRVTGRVAVPDQPLLHAVGDVVAVAAPAHDPAASAVLDDVHLDARLLRESVWAIDRERLQPERRPLARRAVKPHPRLEVAVLLLEAVRAPRMRADHARVVLVTLGVGRDGEDAVVHRDGVGREPAVVALLILQAVSPLAGVERVAAELVGPRRRPERRGAHRGRRHHRDRAGREDARQHLLECVHRRAAHAIRDALPPRGLRRLSP